MPESSAMVSRYPEITVSGVRSSCEAFATKSLRIASRAHLPRHVAGEEQRLSGPVGHQLQRQIQFRCTGGRMTKGSAKSSPCR
jgi:hypothetical protein